MSDLRDKLKIEFQDAEYRYGYAESFLNTKIAMQIKILREQRGKKQSELGELIGTKQSGFSRFEDVNHSVWKTDTLWKIARALDVRLNISFDNFGSLLDEKENFTKEGLERSRFEEDPAFNSSEKLGLEPSPAVKDPSRDLYQDSKQDNTTPDLAALQASRSDPKPESEFMSAAGTLSWRSKKTGVVDINHFKATHGHPKRKMIRRKKPHVSPAANPDITRVKVS